MQQYQINTSAIASEDFGDEVIIVNLARGNYYSLRGSGAFVWQGLQTNCPADALAARLVARYTVEEVDAQNALALFLTQLADESLISPVGELPASATPAEGVEGGKQPFLAPMLEVFTDMQDLILLDPIHDVNAETGWPAKK